MCVYVMMNAYTDVYLCMFGCLWRPEVSFRNYVIPQSFFHIGFQRQFLIKKSICAQSFNHIHLSLLPCRYPIPYPSQLHALLICFDCPASIQCCSYAHGYVAMCLYTKCSPTYKEFCSPKRKTIFFSAAIARFEVKPQKCLSHLCWKFN